MAKTVKPTVDKERKREVVETFEKFITMIKNGMMMNEDWWEDDYKSLLKDKDKMNEMLDIYLRTKQGYKLIDETIDSLDCEYGTRSVLKESNKKMHKRKNKLKNFYTDGPIYIKIPIK